MHEDAQYATNGFGSPDGSRGLAGLMNLERLSRITVEEGKCGGRPCIRGQRILVTDVLPARITLSGIGPARRFPANPARSGRKQR
jgi:Protein of unknown function (DUF433)